MGFNKGRVICYVVPELIPVAFCTSRPCTLVPLLFVHRSNRICTSGISQIMFIGSKNPLIFLGQNPQQQCVTSTCHVVDPELQWYSDPDDVVSDLFHFEAVPDPDPDPTPRFRHAGIQVITYIHSSACLYCFIFLVSFIGCDNIQYFEQYGTGILNFYRQNSKSFTLGWNEYGSGSGKIMPMVQPDPDPRYQKEQKSSSCLAVQFGCIKLMSGFLFKALFVPFFLRFQSPNF
jgi:hypothetical protein